MTTPPTSRPTLRPTTEDWLDLFLLGAWFLWPIDKQVTSLRQYTTVHHVMAVVLQLLGYTPADARRLIRNASRDRAAQSRFRRFAQRVDMAGTREDRLLQIQTSQALILHRTDLAGDTNWTRILYDTPLYLTRAGAIRATTVEEKYAQFGVTYPTFLEIELVNAAYFASLDPEAKKTALARFRRNAQLLASGQIENISEGG